MESLTIIIGDLTICCEGPSGGVKGLSDTFRCVVNWFMQHRPSLVITVRRIFLKDRCTRRPGQYVPCDTRDRNLRPEAQLIQELKGVNGVLAPGVAAQNISSRICASLPVCRIFYPQTAQAVGAVLNQVCF